METVTDFIFLGSRMIVGGDCSHGMKRYLPLGRKAMTKPRQHIKTQRHYFADQVHLVTAMVFPAVMYGCDSWIIKKAECQ